MGDAVPVTIDVEAPVISHRRLLIPAPCTTVWAAHADVSRWPEWQSDIIAASINGPFAVGSTITWSTSGIAEPIPSIIYAIEPQHRTLWGGPAMGITGIHEWRFSDVEGGTLVETNESWSGGPVEADLAMMQALLDASLDAWLRRLQERAASCDLPGT